MTKPPDHIPSSDSQPADADLALFAMLREVGIIHQLSSAQMAKVMPHDLTMAQFILLDHLNRLSAETHGDWSPQRLARAFQVSKATMTSTLQRSQFKGHVEIVPDPGDGRAKIVTITDAGKSALADVKAALGPEIAKLSGKLDPAMVARILPELMEIRAVLDRMREG